MDKVLRLTGHGEASKAPDRIEISLTISVEDKDYAKGVQGCDRLVIALIKALIDGGFKDEEIKTTDFRVRSITKYVENFKTGKYVFDRYGISHSLRIKFAFDKTNLAKCVDIITQSLSEPNFSIRFTVEDDEEIKDQALQNAVKEAQKRANLLATSAGVKLGSIKLIDHSISQINIVTPRSYDYQYDGAVMAKRSAVASMESINVEDIKVSANVTMEWEII